MTYRRFPEGLGADGQAYYLDQAQRLLTLAINVTPTSPLRDKMTEANNLILSAIAEVKAS